MCKCGTAPWGVGGLWVGPLPQAAALLCGWVLRLQSQVTEPAPTSQSPG